MTCRKCGNGFWAHVLLGGHGFEAPLWATVRIVRQFGSQRIEVDGKHWLVEAVEIRPLTSGAYSMDKR